ncbi:MAG: TetR/AcrR family transcriptional regulator [Acutalibacteraceae bacterium]
MADTKEKILYAALKLFAKDGYEAVSVSMIASQLGITKGALYKHYKNKRDIFNSILERMSKADSDNAEEYEMPNGTAEEMPQAYKKTAFEEIRAYSKAQFRRWTQDEFSSNFRKMLTLEQYRNDEMGKLYQQYLSSGPLSYMVDIFAEMLGSEDEAMQTALDFFGPFFLLLSVYDEQKQNKQEVLRMVDCHIDSFEKVLNERIGKGDNE